MHVEKKQHAFVNKQQYTVADAFIALWKMVKKYLTSNLGLRKNNRCQFEFCIFILNNKLIIWLCTQTTEIMYF